MQLLQTKGVSDCASFILPTSALHCLSMPILQFFLMSYHEIGDVLGPFLATWP
jgi:hypothetical protein